MMLPLTEPDQNKLMQELHQHRRGAKELTVLQHARLQQQKCTHARLTGSCLRSGWETAGVI